MLPGGEWDGKIDRQLEAGTRPTPVVRTLGNAGSFRHANAFAPSKKRDASSIRKADVDVHPVPSGE